MIELFVAIVISAFIGYGISEIRRDVAQSKLSEMTFTERVKVTVIMHMTRDLADRLDRLGGASWVMDKIICTQAEDMPEELPHTLPPKQRGL